MTERAPQQLIETIRPWFTSAFAEQAPDEGLVWELGIMTLPQAPGQFVTSLVLYAHMPGAVLNTVVLNAVQLPPFAVTEEQAANAVRALLGILRESRSSQLEEMQQQGAEDPRRPMGLITP